MSITFSQNEDQDKIYDSFFLINQEIDLKPNTTIQKTSKQNLIKIDNNSVYSKDEMEKIKQKKKEDEKEKNNIRDKLKCYICFGKVVDAMMCPSCKNFACQKCVKSMLQNSKICINCKNAVEYNQMVKLPMIDDFTNFFIKNMEQNENNINDTGVNYEKILNEIRKKNCKEHHENNVENYCFNCNEYLCDDCLLIFNKESITKHNNHIILSLDDIENFKLYKIIKEYKKLLENNSKITKKVNNYKKYLNEINSQKKKTYTLINKIEENIKSKYNKKISDINNILITLQAHQKLIQKRLGRPINANNELLDESENQKIFEGLKLLNNISINEQNIINEADFPKNIKCETYESDFFEFILPNKGKYIEEYNIISNQELTFITNMKCKFNMQLLHNEIIFTLIIEVNKKELDEHEAKFIGYLTIESISERIDLGLQGYLSKNELILSGDFNFKRMKDIINKDKKCYYKFYINKFYYK